MTRSRNRCTSHADSSTVTRRRVLLAASAFIPSVRALAQEPSFPTKPVRIIYPLPAGSANDIALRTVAQRLSQKWGQSVIVENKPGGSTIIGTDAVVRAPADGYTLLAGISLLVQNAALGRKLPFDVQRDLRPVAQIHQSPLALLARADLPANTFAEVIALARRSKSALHFASWGLGSTAHIVYEKTKLDQKIDYTHVPYKGGAEIITALLSGDVQVGMADLLSPAPHIKAGKLKVIAVTGPQRHPDFPKVPTLTESGVQGFANYGWLGLFAPSQIEMAVAQQINRSVNEVLAEPAVMEKFKKDLVIEPVQRSVDEWSQLVERDLTNWRALIRMTKMKVDF